MYKRQDDYGNLQEYSDSEADSSSGDSSEAVSYTHLYAIQGPDSINAMNAMLDKPIDELKRFGICERKIGDIPVYIHR